jgi:sugar O-acyltransferase (sialic acid O-acetyltransferase NeuD family)
MEDGIAILGAGGHARETYWYLKTVYGSTNLVFVDDVTGIDCLEIDGTKIPVIQNWKFNDLVVGNRKVESVKKFIVGVAAPPVKRLLVSKALDSGLTPCSSLVHPSAIIAGEDCRIGAGGLIAPGCIITTNVAIGDYVIINYNTTIGHDSTLGDYSTCNPGSSISGNVNIGEDVLIGAGTIIREKINIAPGVVAGAQACIVKDIDTPHIVVAGVPAKQINEPKTVTDQQGEF